MYPLDPSINPPPQASMSILDITESPWQTIGALLLIFYTWPRLLLNIIRVLVIIFTIVFTIVFLLVIATIALFIFAMASMIESTTMNPSVTPPSLMLSATEMNEKFLEGFTSPYDLYVADAKIPGAGFGLFVREEVPAGKEVFRATMPAVSAV